MFLSSFESSVDAKKRLSVPAPFRKALGGEDCVFLWPSLDRPCIEGCGQALVEGFEASISALDLMDPRRFALATAILGEVRQAKFDEGGRIVLENELIACARLKDRARFVGQGDRFQIWDPDIFREHTPDIRKVALESLNLLKPRAMRPNGAGP